MSWKTNPTTGIIIGNVTGADGATPVVDARITRDGSSYTALSSGDGVYSMPLVAPGTYTLTCTRNALGTRIAQNVSVSAGQVVRVNFTFQPVFRSVTQWRSIRLHDGTPRAIVLDAEASGNGLAGPTVETRGSASPPGSGGIQQIELQFDGTITLLDPGQITVIGRTTTSGTLGDPVAYTPSSVSSTGSTIVLTFSEGLLPDETCYTVTVNPAATQEVLLGDTNCMARALLGDTTGDGQITLSDVVWTGSKIGSSVSADVAHDVDLSDSITGADMLAIKARVASPPRLALCP
jgi:hypothetical protein